MKYLKLFEEVYSIETYPRKLFSDIEDICDYNNMQITTYDINYDDVNDELRFAPVSAIVDENDESIKNFYVASYIEGTKRELKKKFGDLVSFETMPMGGMPGFTDDTKILHIKFKLNSDKFIKFMIDYDLQGLLKLSKYISEDIKKKYDYIFDSEELGML